MKFDDKEMFTTAHKLLANLKKVHRYESTSTFNPQNGKNFTAEAGNEYGSRSIADFKLATKMSKFVKHTNSSVNKVLDTLNKTATFNAHAGGQGQAEQQPPESPELANISDVDTATLLNNTNVSIKNLNHSLMKLVAVQQESIIIAKGSVQTFLMMDRVPVYLEIPATNMPHPGKLTIRADPKRNKGIPADVLNQIVQQNVTIYLSTQTKNPGQRNN